MSNDRRPQGDITACLRLSMTSSEVLLGEKDLSVTEYPRLRLHSLCQLGQPLGKQDKVGFCVDAVHSTEGEQWLAEKARWI
jgi:hypothetical protein